MATKPRASDPLWVECCRLWDEITKQQRAIIVKAMEGMVEMNKESQDETADTPSQS